MKHTTAKFATRTVAERTNTAFGAVSPNFVRFHAVETAKSYRQTDGTGGQTAPLILRVRFASHMAPVALMTALAPALRYAR